MNQELAFHRLRYDLSRFLKSWFEKTSIFITITGDLIKSDYIIEDLEHLKNIQRTQLDDRVSDQAEKLNRIIKLLDYSRIEHSLKSFLNEYEEINYLKDINSFKENSLSYNNRLSLEFERLERIIELKVKEYQKKNNLKIYSFRKGGNYIYHGMDLDQAKVALEENKLKGYTHQRYWKDGLRRKDNHPEYENAYIMKGISLTREFDFGISWGSILLILDKEKIRNNNKLIPYSWNFSIGKSHKAHYKKEKEEFLKLAEIHHNGKRKFDPEFQKEYQYYLDNKELMLKEYDDNLEALENYFKTEAEKYDLRVFQESHGEIELSKILKGFVIKSNEYLFEETLDYFINHPLFLGFYEK